MRTMDESMNETGLKEHPEGSKKLDIEAIEDPELINTVQARMENLNLITGRKKGVNPAALDDDDDDSNLDDDVSNDDDDDQAVSGDDDDDSTPEKESKEAEIPDAYIRAAKGNGWNDEDIGAFVKASPEVAMKTFENIYRTWNKASQEFAANGRASQQQVTKPESDEVKKLEYGGVNIRKLKKEFDVDPAVESMIESQNENNEKLVDALNDLLKDKGGEPVQNNQRADRAVKSYDAATQAAEEQQINGFFAADSMKPYDKFYGELRYGETWEQLPPTQARNRYAVYQTADQLLSGAVMTGYSMQLDEALERAHLLVTVNMREEVIRSDIKGKVTKRRNSIVFKPSEGKSKGVESGGKPRTKNQLEANVARLIAKAKKT